MTTTQVPIWQDLRSLAQRRGWEQVSELVDVVLGKQTIPLLIATAEDVDAAALRAWIFAERGASTPVEVISLGELQSDPLRALRAEKVIVLFACGQLISADALEALAGAIFNRPPQAYAIVLGGADRLGGTEDLEVVEYGAWNVLVPEPKAAWVGQDLLQHRCYLWGQGVPAALAGRVERDRGALAAWIGAPTGAESEDLTLLRGEYALALAEDLCEYAPPLSEGRGPDTRQIRDLDTLRETLAESRQRLLRRLDNRVGVTEQQLIASLETREQHLLGGLERDLARRMSLVPSPDEDQLKQIVAEYIARAMGDWDREAAGLLAQQDREFTAEVRLLLDGIAWPLINSVTEKQTPPRTYPAALFDALNSSAEFRALDQGWNRLAGAPTGRGNDLSQTISTAVIGSVIGVGAGFLLGLSPLGYVAAGAAAAVGGSAALRHYGRHRAAEEGSRIGRRAIHEYIGAAIDYVRTHVREAVAPVRARIVEEFRVMEHAADQALVETQQATTAVPERQISPDRELLAGLRERMRATGRSR